jgi:glycosyltransferase involved in cell wall biosynthesis
MLIDALLIPSRWEGMPNVLFESLLRNKPVIATNVGGIAEVKQYSSGVYFYDHYDQESLQKAVSHVITNYDTIYSALTTERHRIGNEFSVSKMVACHESLYKELLDK